MIRTCESCEEDFDTSEQYEEYDTILCSDCIEEMEADEDDIDAED